MEALTACVREHRLVTLCGAGGCGKTRMAIQAATDLLREFRDGCWLVEFAGLTAASGHAASGLPEAVLAALRVVIPKAGDATATLLEHLRPLEILLVLDNCEHLLEGVADLVERVYRACSKVRILATSQVGLGVAGEREHPLPLLGCPTARDAAGRHLTELMDYDAIRLFVDRAAALSSEFGPGEPDGPAVAEICRRLDGMPLLIEMAAATTDSYTVNDILHGLDHLKLKSGHRTAAPRHESALKTFEWAYSLLGEPAQRLLQCLSVFKGTFDAAGAAAVYSAGEPVTTTADDARDLLTFLVKRSQVQPQLGVGRTARFRLLEGTRQFAERHLLEFPQRLSEVRNAHFRYYYALCQEGGPHTEGAKQFAWFDRFEEEYENLLTAIDWSAGDPARRGQGMDMLGWLWRFWYVRPHLATGRRLLHQFIDSCDTKDHSEGRARSERRRVLRLVARRI